MKRPNFLKRWLYRIVRDVGDYKECDNPTATSIGSAPQYDPLGSLDSLDRPVLNFRVHFADGGRIVQMNHYNNRTDKSSSNLYIITEDKDIGTELGKIITMEGLRR